MCFRRFLNSSESVDLQAVCFHAGTLTKLCAQQWQCEVGRRCHMKARKHSTGTSGFNSVRQIRWTRPIEDGMHDAAQCELDAPSYW